MVHYVNGVKIVFKNPWSWAKQSLSVKAVLAFAANFVLLDASHTYFLAKYYSKLQYVICVICIIFFYIDFDYWWFYFTNIKALDLKITLRLRKSPVVRWFMCVNDKNEERSCRADYYYCRLIHLRLDRTIHRSSNRVPYTLRIRPSKYDIIGTQRALCPSIRLQRRRRVVSIALGLCTVVWTGTAAVDGRTVYRFRPFIQRRPVNPPDLSS